ncbi:MAG: hypothetical protein J7L07_10850 [Candidatus Odinarchaeota archaeon]|nr:hypothetical protein [Candidatus Odinarchaeota archaeon]
MKMVRMLKIDPPPQRIHVIPNGIDFKYIDKVASKVRRRSTGSLKRIVYVGRLVGYKNIDHLIYAVKQLLKRNFDVF